MISAIRSTNPSMWRGHSLPRHRFGLARERFALCAILRSAVSGWLSSCVTPAAIWPIAAIFAD